MAKPGLREGKTMDEKETILLLEASRYAESIVETVREPLLVLDADLKIISANPSFYRTFQAAPAETIGSFIYDLGNRQWDIPRLRDLLETILPQKTSFDDYEVEHDFATIGKRTMLLNARQIQRVLGKEQIILLAIEDITEQKLKEARCLQEQMVEERAKQLRQQSDTPPAGGNDTILLVDDEPHVLSALTRILRNSRYEVLTADSAGEALKIMESTKIKVIVSDEQMVGMRGSELLAEVQKRFPHAIRILLTGHATLEASMRAVNQGHVYRFLTKPWDEAMFCLSLSAATEKYNSDAARRRLQEELRKSHDLLEQRVEERTKQLQESEEKFRTFADWTYDWEYWINPQDRVFRYISPSVERITGYSRDAFLADPGLMDRIIHPDDRPLWDRNVEENRSKTDVSELTFRIITASGEVRWIGHICQVVIAADGRRLGRRSSNRDITRRKLAEETLRKSEERLQLAIEAADVGIFEFDAVNNRLTWDATMCRFYGIT
ncbi:MAG: PAS domain S-box protein, partial [Syntrophales bacterium]